ncbi:trpE operon leader peptide TrpLE [Rhizobium sp. LjRoot98]|uniref:TrpE operon leader peptide TrpLE n=1 Tax=Mycoplana ramosa TaxID=40837 RepID=A0ABW3Z032_MYCRA|nr:MULTISPECIES: trpE operon leader peptide TrpLE [Rhizobiaceae]
MTNARNIAIWWWAR